MLVETCRCVTGGVFRDGRWHGGGRPESGFWLYGIVSGTKRRGSNGRWHQQEHWHG